MRTGNGWDVGERIGDQGGQLRFDGSRWGAGDVTPEPARPGRAGWQGGRTQGSTVDTV